jgi:hypothetical protein
MGGIKTIMELVDLKLKEEKPVYKFLLLKLYAHIDLQIVNQQTKGMEVFSINVQTSNGICGVSYVFDTVEQLRDFDPKSDYISIKVG